MAINKDLIIQNEALKTLSDEQIQAIETLSLNDENTVIAKKVGEIHGAYEKDLEAAGFKKPEGWRNKDGKSAVYHYLKEAVLPVAMEANTLKSQLDAQKAKVTELETKISSGSNDEVLKQQLKDANKKFEDLNGLYTKEKSEFESKLNTEKETTKNILVNSEIEKALSGLKIKGDDIIPESVRKAFIENAKQKIISKNKPDFIENGNGGKVLVFRNENGDILNNPSKGLAPFSAKDLLEKELKDILEPDKSQGGAGGGSSSKSKEVNVDLSQAKTQVEADTMIREMLMKQGEVRGTASMQEKHNAMRKANPDIAKLPIN